MIRRYETVFIVRTDLSLDEISGVTDRYAGIIGDMNGTIIKVENWGKRRLAYPIEKKREGFYVRIDFVAPHEVVSEVERNFKIDENILRFQTVKLADTVDMEEIEREIAEARRKEEEQQAEEQKRAEERKRAEEQKKAEEQKEETVSEPAPEEATVLEDPDGGDIKAEEENAQESAPVETDDERAKEE